MSHLCQELFMQGQAEAPHRREARQQEAERQDQVEQAQHGGPALRLPELHQALREQVQREATHRERALEDASPPPPPPPQRLLERQHHKQQDQLVCEWHQQQQQQQHQH